MNMATNPDTIDDDVLDLEGFEDEEANERFADNLAKSLEGGEDDDDADAPPPVNDNATIRQMRARIRELERETAEKNKPAPIEVGERPVFGDGSQWDYDEAKHEAAVDAWAERKVQAALQAKEAPPASDFKAIYQQSADAFNKAQAELVTADPDAADVLVDVGKALGVEKTAAMIQAFKGGAPAILAAIGRDPDTMDRFADMTDPWAMIAEAARLEKPPMARQRPELDAPVRGKAPTAASTDKQLAKLEAEADRTGDRTALLRYRKEKAKKKS